LKQKLRVEKEIRKRQCERDFHAFLLDAYEAIYQGQALDDNWHIKYLCNIMQAELERIMLGKPKIKDIIINVPPRSLKSFITTIAFPAWAWIHKPSLKVIASSYSQDLSLKHNVLTKNILESSWYVNQWGNLISSSADSINTKEYFESTSKGIRACTSTGGTVTGLGGDIIIVDDPINPKKATSDVERQVANEFFDRTLSTRLDNPDTGLFIVIMQRLHDDDLTGHLMKLRPLDFTHICIPAELTNNILPEELAHYYTDNLFFQKRFPQDYLNKQKIALGSYGYAGQMLQSPTLSGGGIVKRAWFKTFSLKELPEDRAVWNFVVDAAYTKKTYNDPSALIAFCVHQNNVYIRSVSRVWYELPQLIRHIRTFAYENGYTYKSKIYIEPKASGISAAQQIKASMNLNIILDESPKDDKVTRLSEVSPIIEAGRVHLLFNAGWVDSFLEEVELFPNGSNDDQVDCLSMLLRKVLKINSKARYTFLQNPTMQ